MERISSFKRQVKPQMSLPSRSTLNPGSIELSDYSSGSYTFDPEALDVY
jgi:hypothetical protein